MWSALFLIVCLCLYSVFDAWYFIRGFILGWVENMKLRRLKKSGRLTGSYIEQNILRSHNRHGVVMPTDIDFLCHMNNARYLRECDFGRLQFLICTNLWSAAKQRKGYFVLGASTARYRKPLHLFNSFVLNTKAVHWDGSNIYFEQRFEDPSNGFVYAVVYAKIYFVNIPSVNDLISELCGHQMTPPPAPEDLKYWIDHNDASSKRLRPLRT